jgi:N-carbamoylputrescine amidase
MDDLNLAMVQLGAVEGDIDATLAKAEDLIGEAATGGAQLAVLPEFFSREYWCQYRELRYTAYAEDEDDGKTFEAVRRWAQEYGLAIIAGVYERAAAGLLFDTAIFVDEQGVIRGRYRKTHPAAVRSLEKLYFRGGVDWPVVELAGWRVGAVICYDLWFPEATRAVALNGAEVVVAPFATFDEPLWPEFIRCRAFENGVYFAACNKVGKEGEWLMQGRSTVADPYGDVVLECSDNADEVGAVTLERSALDSARTEVPLWRDRRPSIYGRVIEE